MSPALRRQYARLEQQRIELLHRLDDLTDAQQAFRPEANSWSLADVVHHLILVEEAFVRHGRGQAGGRPARVTMQSRIRERIVRSFLARDVRVRTPTDAVVPRSHVPLALLGTRWVAARGDLQQYLTELAGPVWTRTAFFHPRIGWMTAAGGLRFLKTHTRHHLRQVDRILAADGFPPGARASW